MKRNILRFLLGACVVSGLFSCENGDWEFPDNEFSAVYFGSQNPIRTITLGEDIYDTSMDNEHKFQIVATIAGVYNNNKDVTIDIDVDNSLCDGFVFDGGGDIVAMPSTHYTLTDNKIVIRSGEILGGVTVQLTDAYFNDPLSTKLTYVIPVVMKHVNGADSILCGKAQDGIANPNRVNADDWSVQPKDYVLYAVKYISKYDANYLRRGVDTYTGAKNGTETRRASDVEKDEVILNQFTTLGVNTVEWARPTKNLAGDNIDCRLKLDFDTNGNCTVSSNSAAVAASGNGQFVAKGDKNSWGGKDRDVLYLDYTIDYDGIKCATKDTLVVRDRGVKAEWFKVVKK